MFRAEMLKRLLQHNRPTAAQVDVRSHVGKWGISGRTALLAETT